MGYDLRWLFDHEDDADVIAAYRALPVSLQERGGHGDTIAAYYGRRSYFRAAMGGMWQFVAASQSLGMVCAPGYTQHFVYPDLPDDITWDEVENVEEGKLPPTPAITEYLGKLKKHLSEHRGECPGIPEHKFSSNDGWHVTPPEIAAALRVYDSVPNAETLAVEVLLRDGHHLGAPYWAERWQSWINFLRGAESHGGFYVN